MWFERTQPSELAVYGTRRVLYWGVSFLRVLLAISQEDQFSEHGCEFRDFVLKEFLSRFDLKNDQNEAAALCAEEGLTPYVARLSDTLWGIGSCIRGLPLWRMDRFRW